MTLDNPGDAGAISPVRYDVIDANQVLTQYITAADHEAFRKLVGLYQPMVYSVCRRVLGTHGEAEEATQETFIKLSRHAASIHGNVGAWLYTCAMNVSRDARHSKQVRIKHERRCSDQWSDHDDDHDFDDEEFALLNQCMADLCDQDREVIALYFFLGMTQEQIGVRYGISQVAVKKRIDKALRTLRCDLISHGLDIPLLSKVGSLDSGAEVMAFGAALAGWWLCGSGWSGQACQLAGCTIGVSWGIEFGERSAKITNGMLMTTPDRLAGRLPSVFRLTTPSWRKRLVGIAVDVLCIGSEAAVMAYRVAGSAVMRVVGALRPAKTVARWVY
ncbi:MAG: sigma-70 family RNA polymerase sigma factor [Planctomycetes bacterium]|nr:sigma-70 family RNA polymerase sigma factor [Planctomycetota bacterium]